MENPYYSPNPAPVQTPTPTPTQDSNFRLIAGVFVVIILLLGAFIVYSLSRQTIATNNNTEIENTETNQDVANDPLDEDTENTDLENQESTDEIYTSENFNLTFHYPREYGTTTVTFDDGETNERCSKETISFTSSDTSVSVYNDREQGAQTCLPATSGTTLEEYTNTNAYGNSFATVVLNQSGEVEAISTEQILGEDGSKFVIIFTVKGATAEEVRDEMDALTNSTEFDTELR